VILMFAGKPAAALVEIVPVAPILPPDAMAAEALRMVTVSPSIFAVTAISRSRTLLCGSTNPAPAVENVPWMAGLRMLPETLASSLSVPETSAPRSARKRFARPSGALPLILTSIPLPASGTLPLAETVNP
jgi:hypothetical protein